MAEIQPSIFLCKLLSHQPKLWKKLKPINSKVVLYVKVSHFE